MGCYGREPPKGRGHRALPLVEWPYHLWPCRQCRLWSTNSTRLPTATRPTTNVPRPGSQTTRCIPPQNAPKNARELTYYGHKPLNFPLTPLLTLGGPGVGTSRPAVHARCGVWVFVVQFGSQICETFFGLPRSLWDVSCSRCTLGGGNDTVKGRTAGTVWGREGYEGQIGGFMAIEGQFSASFWLFRGVFILQTGS